MLWLRILLQIRTLAMGMGLTFLRIEAFVPDSVQAGCVHDTVGGSDHFLSLRTSTAIQTAPDVFEESLFWVVIRTIPWATWVRMN